MNSDSNKETTPGSVPTSPAEDPTPTQPKTPPPKRAWSAINHDLKKALNTWEDLSEQMAEKLSPEEEQLREVKRLLGELKDKLKEFSE